LWEKPVAEDNKHSTKLKVELKYNANETPAPTRLPQSAADHASIVQERLARNQAETISNASSPEMMMQELQNLRKKYDGVVEYTVHITAERDNLLQQLEVAQKDLSKEKAKRKDTAGQSTKLGEKVDKKQVDKVRLFETTVLEIEQMTIIPQNLFLGFLVICSFNHCSHLLFGGKIYWLKSSFILAGRTVQSRILKALSILLYNLSMPITVLRPQFEIINKIIEFFAPNDTFPCKFELQEKQFSVKIRHIYLELNYADLYVLYST
jgi:hypothetical protein